MQSRAFQVPLQSVRLRRMPHFALLGSEVQSAVQSLTSGWNSMPGAKGAKDSLVHEPRNAPLGKARSMVDTQAATLHVVSSQDWSPAKGGRWTSFHMFSVMLSFFTACIHIGHCADENEVSCRNTRIAGVCTVDVPSLCCGCGP